MGLPNVNDVGDIGRDGALTAKARGVDGFGGEGEAPIIMGSRLSDCGDGICGVWNAADMGDLLR